MPEFDPYLKWLGIRETGRPINHYRLLGLEMFESDAEVISLAADRQMAHIRTYQNGPHGDYSQKIMSELAIARRCLLEPGSKQTYDQQIRATTQPVLASPPQTIPHAIPVSSVSMPSIQATPAIRVQADAEVRTKRKKREQSNLMLGLIGWLTGAIAAVGIGGWIVTSGVIPGVGLSQNIEIDEANETLPSQNETRKSLGGKSSVSQPQTNDSALPESPLDQRPRPAPSNQEATTTNRSSPPLKNPSQDNLSADLEANTESKPKSDSDTEFGQLAFGNSFNKKPSPETTDSSQATGVPKPIELSPLSPLGSQATPPTKMNPGDSEETATPAQKSRIPSKKEVKSKQGELLSLYSKQITGAKNADQLMVLGKLMLEDSRTARPNSPMHFVMLDQAIEVASRAGDAVTALTAIREQNQGFEFEYWDRITTMMEDTAPNVSQTKTVEFKSTLDSLIAETIETQKFDQGNELTGLAISLAKRAKDDKLINQYQILKRKIAEHVRLVDANQQAEQTLQTDPDDSAANFTHGEYLFVVENDLENALTYWSKSKDKRLDNVLVLESELNPESSDQFKQLTDLASAWEKMGQNKTSFFDRKGLQRAIELNQLALPYVTGLDQRWVESNIARLETMLSD